MTQETDRPLPLVIREGILPDDPLVLAAESLSPEVWHHLSERILLLFVAVLRDSYRLLPRFDDRISNAWYECIEHFGHDHLINFLTVASGSHLASSWSPTALRIVELCRNSSRVRVGLFDLFESVLVRKRRLNPAEAAEFYQLLTRELAFLEPATIDGSTDNSIEDDFRSMLRWGREEEAPIAVSTSSEHVAASAELKDYRLSPPFLRVSPGEVFSLSPLLRRDDGENLDTGDLYHLQEINRKFWQYDSFDNPFLKVTKVTELLVDEGVFFAKKKDYLFAETFLRLAYERTSRNDEVKSQILTTFLWMVEVCLKSSETAQAESLLQVAFEMFPKHPNLVVLLGKLRYRQRRFKDALDLLKPLSTSSKPHPKVVELVARCNEKMGNDAEALAWYKRAMTLSPENPKLQEAYKRLQLQPVEQKKPAPAAASGGDDKKFDFHFFTIDLCELALSKNRRPLPARESELLLMLECLSCSKKRNPLLVGDAGVGKSALVLEFARQVARDELGREWSDRRIYQLNVAALVAGARFRGQYEERLLELVEHLRNMPEAILFIDDIHTFFTNAGSRSGNLDPSHVFKPALANGEIQMIGATSSEQYRINLSTDPAVLRSFLTIPVKEPDPAQCMSMLKVVQEDLEDYHKVNIGEEAVASALELSRVFIRDRALPDKAQNLLDIACALARRNMDHQAMPLPPRVTREHVIAATASRSGIPAEKIATRETRRFLHLEDALSTSIAGQREALAAVANVLRVSRTNLKLKPERPDGVFLFAGPTGVGKTELALALTEFLYGDRARMIRIDMSEFMEQISTSKLIGIAPGYVGYHDKNQLSDKVRQEPYSLILLDEIEKASPQVLNLFLQVFDTGRLTDSKGNTVYFDHTVFVLTSNLGTDLYGRSTVGYGSGGRKMQAPVSKVEMLRAIKSHLPPEFINRLDEIIFFNPLSEIDMERILDLQLTAITQRLEREYDLTLDLDEPARRKLIERGFNPEFGARELHRALRTLLLDPLARFLMERGSSGRRRLSVSGRELSGLQMVSEDEEEALMAGGDLLFSLSEDEPL